MKTGSVKGKLRRVDSFTLACGASAGLAQLMAFIECIAALYALRGNNLQPSAARAKGFGHMLDMLGDVFFRDPEHDRQLPAV